MYEIDKNTRIAIMGMQTDRCHELVKRVELSKFFNKNLLTRIRSAWQMKNLDSDKREKLKPVYADARILEVILGALCSEIRSDYKTISDCYKEADTLFETSEFESVREKFEKSYSFFMEKYSNLDELMRVDLIQQINNKVYSGGLLDHELGD